MSKRLIKQTIITLIFLSILSGCGFLIYHFNKPAPSCFDGIQNQGEEEIDCGGPCISCELVHIKEIKVIWVKALSKQDDFYDLAAQINNPNQNYGSDSIPYYFEFYDSENNLIGQYPGTTFILPNQTKYLTRAKVEASQFDKVELSFGEIEWKKLKEYHSLPQLAIQQKEYYLLEDANQPGFSQAKALLINKTDFDFEKVDIDVLLFDSSNHLLGLNTTEVRTLLAGQRRDFVATWFEEIRGQVVLIEIEAETNIFDPDNYLSAKGRNLEWFQEY